MFSEQDFKKYGSYVCILFPILTYIVHKPTFAP